MNKHREVSLLPNDKSTLQEALQKYGLVEIHPATEAIPLMKEEEYEGLLGDVRENGFRERVKVAGGVLIDGRHRLCAAVDTGIDVELEEIHSDNLIKDVISFNLMRRELTRAQKAWIAVELEDLYSQEARERSKQNLKQYQSGGQGSETGEQAGAESPGDASGNVAQTTASDVPNSEHRGERSIEKAARQMGVGKDAVYKTKKVKEIRPDLGEELRRGERSTNSAYREVKAKERKQKQEASGQNDVRTVSVYDEQGQEWESRLVGESGLQEVVEELVFARWQWNPVTGCRRDCQYCRVREAIGKAPSTEYPKGFEPMFWPHRLKAPRNTELPEEAKPRDRRVLVCGQGDLFGEWVPEAWIKKVLQAAKEAPGFEYLFITKNPKRCGEFELPEGAAVGVKVDPEENVAEKLDELRQLPGAEMKWTWIDPLQEPIKTGFSGINWVVIGDSNPGVEWEWIYRIFNKAGSDGAGVVIPHGLKVRPRIGKPGSGIPRESQKTDKNKKQKRELNLQEL